MLAEDEGFGDITSNAVVEKDKIVNASIVSKDEGILAGIDVIRELFEEYGIEINEAEIVFQFTDDIFTHIDDL